MKVKLFLALLVSLTVSVLGCKDEVIGQPEAKSLSEAKSLWESSNISNYKFSIRRNCFCVDVSPYQISVSNKAITAVKNEQGQDVQFAGKDFKTIDGMFEYIENALSKNPAKANITYNSVYGYPMSIYIDFDERLADEEMGYEISGFAKR